jgi:hypothetical protein
MEYGADQDVMGDIRVFQVGHQRENSCEWRLKLSIFSRMISEA